MCHNHSHLLVESLAEVTGEEVIVLTFQLKDPLVKLEGPGGMVVKVLTSGHVYVPAVLQATWSASDSLAMVEPGMSLFFMLDDDLTGILETLKNSPPSPATSLTQSARPGGYPIDPQAVEWPGPPDVPMADDVPW